MLKRLNAWEFITHTHTHPSIKMYLKYYSLIWKDIIVGALRWKKLKLYSLGSMADAKTNSQPRLNFIFEIVLVKTFIILYSIIYIMQTILSEFYNLDNKLHYLTLWLGYLY